MPALFSQDSALMRGLSRLADVMILNVLFIATSLPLVTLGASLTALNFVALRIAADECGSVSGDYFRSFRRNFRQATVIGAILALFGAVLAAWYVVVTNLAIEPLLEFVLLALWYVVTFGFATTLLFTFPYLARFEGSTRDVLRIARLMSWRHAPTAIGALGFIVLCVALTIFAPQATGYGMLWLIAGFGGIATVNGFLFNRVFSRYVPAPALT